MSESQLHIENYTNYHHITMTGRWLQIADKGLLRRKVAELVEVQKLDVIVDLNEMLALNSEGINDLIRSLAICKQNGLMMVFVRVPQKIIKLLEIVQINSMITICNTLQEAEALLNNRHQHE